MDVAVIAVSPLGIEESSPASDVAGGRDGPSGVYIDAVPASLEIQACAGFPWHCRWLIVARCASGCPTMGGILGLIPWIFPDFHPHDLDRYHICSGSVRAHQHEAVLQQRLGYVLDPGHCSSHVKSCDCAEYGADERCITAAAYRVPSSSRAILGGDLPGEIIR